MRRVVLAFLAAATIGVAPLEASAQYKSCRPVVNPYPGTRYERVDLTRIRALGVTCSTARSVARGAHRKALRVPPSDSGVRRFRWKGWRVTGDLRGARDRYRARRGSDRVRWAF